VQIDI